MTEAGLEPGPPDTWPIVYPEQNFEEWVEFCGGVSDLKYFESLAT